MTKKEIFEKLNEMNINKDKCIIVGRTSLVCHGVIKSCDDLEIIDYNDEEYDEINGFRFLSVNSCLKKIKTLI